MDSRRLECTRCNGGHIQKRKMEGNGGEYGFLHCLQPFQRVNDPGLLGKDQRNGEDSTTGKIRRNIRVGIWMITENRQLAAIGLTNQYKG